MNRHNLYSSFLPHITLFVPLPPVCSILVFILLLYCPIHLPGFMSSPYTFYPNPNFLAQPLSAPPPLPDSFPSFLFSLLWLHANLPALLLYLSLFPTCSQSQSSLSDLSVFPRHVTFSFIFCLVCLYLHPGSLPRLSSSLSLHLFHAVSSKAPHFIHALFYFFPFTLSTLLLVSFPQPTFSNLFHFADHRWLWSPFFLQSNRKNIFLMYTVLRREIYNEFQTSFPVSRAVLWMRFAMAEKMLFSFWTILLLFWGLHMRLWLYGRLSLGEQIYDLQNSIHSNSNSLIVTLLPNVGSLCLGICFCLFHSPVA